MNGHYLPARSGCNERNWNNIITHCILLTTHISQISLAEAGRLGLELKEKEEKEDEELLFVSESWNISYLLLQNKLPSPSKLSSLKWYIFLSEYPWVQNLVGLLWGCSQDIGQDCCHLKDWLGLENLLERLLTSMAYMLDWAGGRWPQFLLCNS